MVLIKVMDGVRDHRLADCHNISNGKAVNYNVTIEMDICHGRLFEVSGIIDREMRLDFGHCAPHRLATFPGCRNPAKLDVRF